MEKKTYVPISCSYYDELEALATFKKLVNIQYLDEQGAAQETEDVIKDLFTKEKIEYMLLQSGNSIRLDYLIKVDGKALPHHCSFTQFFRNSPHLVSAYHGLCPLSQLR